MFPNYLDRSINSKYHWMYCTLARLATTLNGQMPLWRFSVSALYTIVLTDKIYKHQIPMKISERCFAPSWWRWTQNASSGLMSRCKELTLCGTQLTQLTLWIRCVEYIQNLFTAANFMLPTTDKLLWKRQQGSNRAGTSSTWLTHCKCRTPLHGPATQLHPFDPLLWFPIIYENSKNNSNEFQTT